VLVAAQRAVTIAQAVLAALGLIVATTGMGSTVWLSILVRRREIGIRMAVGARKATIFSQFVTGALVTTIIGCGIGAGTGAVGVWLLNRNSEVGVTLDPNWIFLALSLALLVAIVSSVGPAYYASRCEPAAAIRRGDG
jgi:putative ABC transport system permease protein